MHTVELKALFRPHEEPVVWTRRWGLLTLATFLLLAAAISVQSQRWSAGPGAWIEPFVPNDNLEDCQPTGNQSTLRGTVSRLVTETDASQTLVLRSRPCYPSVLERQQNQPRIDFMAFKDPDGQSRALTPGDSVSVTYTTAAQRMTLQSVRVFASHTRPIDRFATLLFVAAAMVVALLGFFKRGFLHLCVGKDGRLSNSQAQIATWFFALILSLLTTLLFRTIAAGPTYATGIGIPMNLLLVSGLSAIVFVGARAATEAKVQADPSSKPQFEGELQVSHLYNDDAGSFDLSDFQMLVVTLVAVFSYLLAFLGYLTEIPASGSTSLPDLNTSILALFGLGQGAYLTRKLTGSRGTNTITPITADIDAVVGKPYVGKLVEVQNAQGVTTYSINPGLPQGGM
jgi:hypothetical protein